MVPQHRALALIPFLLALGACPRRPVDFGKDGEAKTAEELLKRIALAETTVYNVKGDGKLGVDAPQGKGSVSIFVGVTHPAYVHLEQLDFFGRPHGVMTTDGENFGLYDAEAGKFFRGPATPPNLARFLPLVMPPQELAALLLGRAPRIPHDSAELAFDAKDGLYVLSLHRDIATQILWVEPPHHRVVKTVVHNVKAYDLEMGEVTTYGGVTLPRRIVLDARWAQTRVELNYKDVEVNQPPDMTLYDLSPPEDVPVIEVDAAGVPRDAGVPTP